MKSDATSYTYEILDVDGILSVEARYMSKASILRNYIVHNIQGCPKATRLVFPKTLPDKWGLHSSLIQYSLLSLRVTDCSGTTRYGSMFTVDEKGKLALARVNREYQSGTITLKKQSWVKFQYEISDSDGILMVIAQYRDPNASHYTNQKIFSFTGCPKKVNVDVEKKSIFPYSYQLSEIIVIDCSSQQGSISNTDKESWYGIDKTGIATHWFTQKKNDLSDARILTEAPTFYTIQVRDDDGIIKIKAYYHNYQYPVVHIIKNCPKQTTLNIKKTKTGYDGKEYVFEKIMIFDCSDNEDTFAHCLKTWFKLNDKGELVIDYFNKYPRELDDMEDEDNLADEYFDAKETHEKYQKKLYYFILLLLLITYIFWRLGKHFGWWPFFK